MDVIEVIKSRRSVRSYSNKEVKHDDLVRILSSARYAPSSGNIQNWAFIVVRNSSKREDISKACLDQRWMVQAPVHIVVCNEVSLAKRAYGSRGESLYGIQNCAALAQNLMLAACSLGLSTCWVGSFDPETISRLLKIPSGFTPQIIITLGYKSDKTTSVAGRHDLANMVFFDGWGKRVIGSELLLEKISKEAGKAHTEVKKRIDKKAIIEKIKRVIKKK